MPDLTEQALGRLQVRVEAPVAAEDDTLAADRLNDWAMTSVYGQPQPPRTFAEATRRHSIWQKRSGHLLFGVAEAPALPHVLRFLGVADRRDYTLRLITSANPLGDGYLTCLRFNWTDTDVQPAGLAEITTAFVEAEQAAWGPDIEEVLKRHYGRPPQDDLTRRVMNFVDFPALDSGVLGLGFGLLIENWSHGVSAFRIWSRPVHSHK